MWRHPSFSISEELTEKWSCLIISYAAIGSKMLVKMLKSLLLVMI